MVGVVIGGRPLLPSGLNSGLAVRLVRCGDGLSLGMGLGERAMLTSIIIGFATSVAGSVVAYFIIRGIIRCVRRNRTTRADHGAGD